MPARRPPATRRTVFLDATPLAERHLTGIGRYAARLALALARRPDARLRFFAQEQEILAPADLNPSHDQDLARWARALWRARRAPLDAPPEGSLAVYPCLRPAARRFPFEVSVLHDFTTLIVPHTHAPRTVAEFQAFFARDLLSSDAALAVSHATRADAAWLCDFDPARIAVAPSGPSLCVDRHAHKRPVARRPEVGLVVSTLEPRKNPFFLLDWFRDTDALPPRAELWWAGPVGWLTSRRKLRRYRGGKGGRAVRFLGVVSDADLCRLYQTAGWSAYPSLYEGFGFPVLDALRHGAPVLASDHSALRELDHPGVSFFDPYDPASLDDAWRRGPGAPGGAAVVGLDTLSALYDWDRVAGALLALRPEAPRAAASAAA